MKIKEKRKKLKVLLNMKKYFEEMKETCEKMLGYTNKELKKLKGGQNENRCRTNKNN